MKAVLLLLVVLSSLGTWARPSEDSFANLLLDQKDPLFYSQGVISSQMPSSLCGPTSAVNWVQLRQQEGFYPKEDLVQMVRLVGQDLRSQQKVEINNGLTLAELISFLQLLDLRLQESASYSSQGIANADIWNDDMQILMLSYAEPVRASQGPVRRLDYNFTRAPLAGRHFVLKVWGNPENSQLWLIDPENPLTYTIVKTEPTTTQQLRLRSVDGKGFKTFGKGVPLIWTATNAISRHAL